MPLGHSPAERRGGCAGCLVKGALILVIGTAATWAFVAALNSWALHIGGRSTPLLFWHGAGVAISKDGQRYPIYLTFWPGRPMGFSGGGRREGKLKIADLSGQAWICVSPGLSERMKLSGSKFGGATSTEGSLFEFRLLEWQRPMRIDYRHRGFFDLAGEFHGGDLVLDRPGEQGIRLNSGPFIDHATATLRFGDQSEFDAACRDSNGQLTQLGGQ